MRRVQSVGLDQHAIEIQAAQQFLERCLLAGLMGVVRLLRQGNTESTGLDGDLSNELVVAVLRLDG